jgi:hypothetical protein
MQPILKFFKALYNFLVGDWIILSGVAILIVLVALLENLSAFSAVKGAGGYLLILGLIITLALTLRRETHH